MRPAENAETTTDARADAIAGRMRGLLNEGMVALLAGLGSRAGWLDALIAVQPAPVAAVARAAGADEARMHAWLAALVAGRLVERDGARGTYALAPELTVFLGGAQGPAFRRGLGELIELAAADVPRARAANDGGPAARELVALIPGLGARLAAGAEVLELRRARSASLAGAPELAACRVAAAALAPGGARFDLVLALDERLLAGPRAAARVAAALVPGGVAVLAVPALSDSPADDVLHPVGAFLLGARALSSRARTTTAAPLGAALAAAGLDVRGLARVPSDPFRNYLIAERPISPNR